MIEKCDLMRNNFEIANCLRPTTKLNKTTLRSKCTRYQFEAFVTIMKKITTTFIKGNFPHNKAKSIEKLVTELVNTKKNMFFCQPLQE